MTVSFPRSSSCPGAPTRSSALWPASCTWKVEMLTDCTVGIVMFRNLWFLKWYEMITMLVYSKSQLNILSKMRRDPTDWPSVSSPGSLRTLGIKPRASIHKCCIWKNKIMSTLIYVYVLSVQLSHIFASDIMCLIFRQVVRCLLHILLNQHKDLRF